MRRRAPKPVFSLSALEIMRFDSVRVRRIRYSHLGRRHSPAESHSCPLDTNSGAVTSSATSI